MKIINDKDELLSHIIEVYGLANTKSGLDDLICREAEEGCSMKDSVRMGCELYHDGILKDDEEAGYIKLNIPLDDILDVLEDISRDI